jgi:hypothetical protein
MKNTNKSPEGATGQASDSRVVELFPETHEFSQGDLGKIQDILFGEQLRASHQQIAQLQASTDEKLNVLTQNFNNQVIELSKKMDLMLEALNQQIEEQHQKLLANGNRQMNDLQNAKQELEKQIVKSDQALVQQRLQHASDIKQCEANLTESIKASHEDIKRQQDQGMVELQNAKIDRDTLSTLFSGVAQQLSQDSSPDKPT